MSKVIPFFLCASSAEKLFLDTNRIHQVWGLYRGTSSRDNIPTSIVIFTLVWLNNTTILPGVPVPVGIIITITHDQESELSSKVKSVIMLNLEQGHLSW